MEVVHWPRAYLFIILEALELYFTTEVHLVYWTDLMVLTLVEVHPLLEVDCLAIRYFEKCFTDYFEKDYSRVFIARKGYLLAIMVRMGYWLFTEFIIQVVFKLALLEALFLEVVVISTYFSSLLEYYFLVLFVAMVQVLIK